LNLDFFAQITAHLPFLSIFVASFISATIFPLGSEALLLYLAYEKYSIYWLLFSATIGNTLGSCVNYYLGVRGDVFIRQKGLIKAHSLDKAKRLFARFGFWSLWLSWVPVIGDPITLFAGMAKYPLLRFVLVVLCAKFLRYLVLIYGASLFW